MNVHESIDVEEVCFFYFEREISFGIDFFEFDLDFLGKGVDSTIYEDFSLRAVVINLSIYLLYGLP